MKIRLLTFGKITEILPAQDWEIEELASVGSLKIQIETRYPELKNLHYLLAVDKKIVHPGIALAENAEVALLPPFSGG